MKQDFAVWLRNAREFAGMTQEEAAKLLSIPRPSISEIEHGNRDLSAREYWIMQIVTQYPHPDLLRYFDAEEVTVVRYALRKNEPLPDLTQKEAGE